MEKQFFTFESWESLDVGQYQFTNCTLVQDVGNWHKGEVIPHILMDYQAGTMEFFDHENRLRTFELRLEIK